MKGGEGVGKKSPLHGGGMGIFWHYTMDLNPDRQNLEGG